MDPLTLIFGAVSVASLFLTYHVWSTESGARKRAETQLVSTWQALHNLEVNLEASVRADAPREEIVALTRGTVNTLSISLAELVDRDYKSTFRPRLPGQTNLALEGTSTAPKSDAGSGGEGA